MRSHIVTQLHRACECVDCMSSIIWSCLKEACGRPFSQSLLRCGPPAHNLRWHGQYYAYYPFSMIAFGDLDTHFALSLSLYPMCSTSTQSLASQMVLRVLLLPNDRCEVSECGRLPVDERRRRAQLLAAPESGHKQTVDSGYPSVLETGEGGVLGGRQEPGHLSVPRQHSFCW